MQTATNDMKVFSRLYLTTDPALSLTTEDRMHFRLGE